MPKHGAPFIPASLMVEFEASADQPGAITAYASFGPATATTRGVEMVISVEHLRRLIDAAEQALERATLLADTEVARDA